MKGSCVALKELWGFLSALWLRFLGRKVSQRRSSVKQRPVHGPWGLALFPSSKATCPCTSPAEEELGGGHQCSRVTHGVEQPGTAAGRGLPSVCLPPRPPSSSMSPDPMVVLGDLFSLLVLGLKLVQMTPAAAYPARPSQGLSITIWRLPAAPSPVTPGHLPEAQTVQ